MTAAPPGGPKGVPEPLQRTYAGEQGEDPPGSNLAVVRPSTTLRDQVVHRLREAIITGRFAPGERLVERHMCELLEVSRTLVREALRQLEAECWVRILPYRGPVVATMSAAEVREFYQVRGALEGLAAQLCAENATPAQFAAMGKAVRALAAAQRRGDRDGQAEQAAIFYDLMRTAAGNRQLQDQLTAFTSRVAWLRSLAFSRPERTRENLLEERALLRALQDRDGPRARALCEGHINAAAIALGETMARNVADRQS